MHGCARRAQEVRATRPTPQHASPHTLPPPRDDDRRLINVLIIFIYRWVRERQRSILIVKSLGPFSVTNPSCEYPRMRQIRHGTGVYS